MASPHKSGPSAGAGGWAGPPSHFLSIWAIIIHRFNSSSITWWLDPRKAKVETARYLVASALKLSQGDLCPFCWSMQVARTSLSQGDGEIDSF